MTNARERVNTCLHHQLPDCNPVDFLATPEIWEKLCIHFGISDEHVGHSDFYNTCWERILKELKVDCRVLSYDQFFSPPDSFLKPSSNVNWFGSLGRSTPNRMWRQYCEGGVIYDIWGRGFEVIPSPSGAYEQNTIFPLSDLQDVQDIKSHAWPDPDWWDFSPVQHVIKSINSEGEYHFRYRIGSVFEVAWQLVGLEKFMLDLTMQPQLPMYLMECLTEIYLAVTEQFLQQAGDAVDMVYFYDDVASQNNLLMSKNMWEKYIKPHHAKIINLARQYGKQVMYHCDGAIDKLIPDLIEMGVNVLNPIQQDAVGMDPAHLQGAYGDKLAFHGGIDIIKTLPEGSTEDVRRAVCDSIQTLGANGGYILASSHHIQSNTPLENVLAMYDLENRTLK